MAATITPTPRTTTCKLVESPNVGRTKHRTKMLASFSCQAGAAHPVPCGSLVWHSDLGIHWGIIGYFNSFKNNNMGLAQNYGTNDPQMSDHV